jgi:hypothetical protein
VAAKVYLHVGLPKTGTTYLQSVLWANRDRLLEQRVLLPGASAREQMWATLQVREHPGKHLRNPDSLTAWPRIVEQANSWPGTAVISHEFFGAATEEQAAAAIAAFGDAEVHLVVTARDLLTVVASYWQEYVKHGWFDQTLETFPPEGLAHEEWSWRTLDLRAVLTRWSATIPADRVHVLVLPGRDEPREALWLRFAEILGVTDAADFDTDRARENSSLAVVEAELMRRIGEASPEFANALDRGVWLRSYLAHGKLVPRGGDRVRPSDRRVDELRARADDAVDYIAGSGFDIVGDLDRLRVPASPPPGREPGTVAEDEIAAAGVETIAAMLIDVRRLRQENTALKKAAAERRREDARIASERDRRFTSRARRTVRRWLG